MTEQQAIEALHALPRLPRSGASLERMQALLDHLGNPEKQFKCIHIAGTNGKGTLAAMTSSILTHAGYKTGLTISPYVLNFRERFQINGQMMSPRTLASLTRKVLDAADAIIAEGGEGPVEFEAVTAIAFLWFARQKCDFAVVETGLGGRYDATNVIPAPLVAAITRIGMDHTEILGDTLAEIAAEKAGIIKEGSVVVCYPEQPEEAMGPLLTAAANAHTSLVVPDTADLQQLKCRPLENYVDYGGYRALLQFPGKHQANHAAMAVEIALALWREYHYEIPDEAIETGLRDAKMPARIEVMRRHPLLLLDGCHNADGTAALAATLKEAGYDGNLVAVLGLLKDKDHSKMLENLAPCFEKVFTVTPDSPRAMTAEELEKEGFAKESIDTYLGLFKEITSDIEGVRYCKEKLKDVLDPKVAEDLETIISTVDSVKTADFKMSFDPTLVRGMSYYTGPIFEISMDEFGGSVGGGGRYDEMIGKFTGNNTSACGFSIGFERIVMLLLERNYEIPTKNGKKAYLIEKNMPADKMLTILKQAQEERNAGTQINISIMKKNKKFQKDQMTAEGYTEFVEFFKDRM